MMIRLRSLTILLFLLASLNILSQEVHYPANLSNSEKLHVTVFIHGSVHCHLSMLSLSGVWKDEINEDSWYIKMLTKVRENPLLWQSRFMLAMGPQQIDSDVIERFHKRALSKEESKIAAYHIVASYDALTRHLESADDDHDHVYYTYGHLGLLSQNYRKQVGLELYEWLSALMNHYKSAYKSVQLDIIAHSHGGNIALWLGAYEDQKRHGLFIDNLIMDGTPIQVETFKFAYYPAFGRVFNRHSDGDHVQGVDRLSTSRGKSYKKFSDARLPLHYGTSNVFDVRLLVNDKRKYVGHGNMVLMDYAPTIHALRPAPLITFMPLFLAACADLNVNEFDCNLVDEPGNVRLELKNQTAIFGGTENIAHLTSELQQLLTYNWRPDANAHLHSQAAQMSRITIDAIRELWQDGAIKKEEMPKLIARL